MSLITLPIAWDPPPPSQAFFWAFHIASLNIEPS